MTRLLAPFFLASHAVGGQAVMEGVMIRSKDRLAIAVRRPDGQIVVESRPWFSLTDAAWLRKPFVRGFPVLLETLVNGIKALNFSARQAMADETGESEMGNGALVLTLIVSLALAMGLFVALPHLISLGLTWLGVAGDYDHLARHAEWADGDPSDTEPWA